VSARSRTKNGFFSHHQVFNSFEKHQKFFKNYIIIIIIHRFRNFEITQNNIRVLNKGGVSITLVALPFTLKSILRQKKNYGNSNIPPSMQK